MEQAERAQRLLRKAAQDEYVIDTLLADGSSPEEPLGFHAQQAAERLLDSPMGNSLRAAFRAGKPLHVPAIGVC